MKWAYLEKQFARHLGQPLDEIYGDVGPHLGRHLKGLQETPPAAVPTSCSAGTWCTFAPNPARARGRGECRTLPAPGEGSSGCPHALLSAPMSAPGGAGRRNPTRRHVSHAGVVHRRSATEQPAGPPAAAGGGAARWAQLPSPS
jgi:hypothetical protein